MSFLKKSLKYLIIIFSISNFSNILHAANIGVYPLYIELNGDGKVEESFEINISSDRSAKIKLSVLRASQNKEGKLDFFPMDEKTMNSILKMKSKTHTFVRAGVWKARGTIVFPKSGNQTEAFTLMVEEVKPSSEKGVSVRVRYAVVLKTTNSSKRVFENGKVNNIKIGFNNQNPVLISEFQNLSLKDFKVSSYAIIRDEKNNFIGKLPLKTKSAWQKQSDTSMIFPKAKVELVGEFEKLNLNGNYEVQVVAKINNKRQIIKKQKIKINTLLNKNLNVAKKIITSFPLKKEVFFKEGRGGQYRFVVKNPTDEDIVIVLPQDKVTPFGDYKFMPRKLVIRKGGEKTAIFKTQKNRKKIWDLSKLKADIQNNLGKSLKKLPLNIIVKRDK